MSTNVRRHRGETFAGYTDLEVEVCTCGVLFAAPKHLFNTRRKDGGDFYCPNGHVLVYNGENDRLRRELRQVKDRLASERSYHDQTKASLRSTKGVVTKMKKRAVAGVCPAGCRRHFANLAEHMHTQHPDWGSDA